MSAVIARTLQDKCIKKVHQFNIIFVQSTEMEEKTSACIYKINSSDVKSAHTHVKCFVLGCKVFNWLKRGR